MNSIEERAFAQYRLDRDKLLSYGFIESNGVLSYMERFHGEEFEARLRFVNGKLSGKVIEIETEDEFVTFRNEFAKGGFLGAIKEEYEAILLRIRDYAGTRVRFKSPQACRLAEYIENKYGDSVEFAWEKFPETALIRHSKSEKWYGIFSYLGKGKLDSDLGECHVIVLRLPPYMVEALLKEKDIYPGYHMNKKSWVTFVLDSSLSDEYIATFIDIAREELISSLSEKKRYRATKKQ